MKAALIVGIILIGLGITSFISGGITYTRQEEVVDIGPLQASTEEKKTIPLPPVLGGIAFAGGVVLVVAGARRKST